MSRSCSNVTPPENVNFSASCSNTPRAALISTGRARAGDFAAVSEGTRCDSDLDVPLQIETFCFLFDDGAYRFSADVFAFERDRRVCLGHTAILIERERFRSDFQFVFRLDADVSRKGKNVGLRDVDGACGGNLIRHVAFRRINLHAHVFEFVMAVGKRGVFRCFDEQIESIVFSDALFVTFDDTGHLFRQLRRF